MNVGISEAALFASGISLGFGLAIILGYLKKIHYRRKKRHLYSVAQDEYIPDGRQTSEIVNRSSSNILDKPTNSFLSETVSHLWEHIDVAAGEFVRKEIEAKFKLMLPVPFKTLHFTKICLGPTPPKFENITYKLENKQTMKIYMDMTWDGECDMKLNARGISFGVQSVKVSGRMCMLLYPLINSIPVVTSVQAAFVNPPRINLSFTGVSKIANFSVIEKSSMKIMNDTCKNMAVMPNWKLVKMDGDSNYLETFRPPMGVMRLVVKCGRGFQVEQGIIQDVPDVYVKVRVGSSDFFKTSTQWNNLSPVWNESCDFLISDVHQLVTLKAFDEDQFPLDADDYIGSSFLTVEKIIEAPEGITEVELIDLDGNGTGCFVTVQSRMHTFTPQLNSLDHRIANDENTICGLLTILIDQAFDLPVKPEKVACYAKIEYRNKKYKTDIIRYLKHKNVFSLLNPRLIKAVQIPLKKSMLKDPSDVVISLHNGDKQLGRTTVTYRSLVGMTSRTITAKRKMGTDGASLRFQVAIHGIFYKSGASTNYLASSIMVRKNIRGERSFIGTASMMFRGTKMDEQRVIRLTLVSGRGFKVKKIVDGVKDNIPDIKTPTILKNSVEKDPVPDMMAHDVKKTTTGRGIAAVTNHLPTIAKPDVKKLPGVKNNLPNIFCQIKLSDSPELVWKTNSAMNMADPIWNQSNDYIVTKQMQGEIIIEAFDENQKARKGFVGRSNINLLKAFKSSKPIEVELLKRKGDVEEGRDSMGVGAYVTLQCDDITHEFEEEDSDVENDNGNSSINKKGPSVIIVTISNGRGFQITERKFHRNEIPDVYCKVKLSSSPSEWQTSTIMDDIMPRWDESHKFLLSNEDDFIDIRVYDYNKKFEDELLGTAEVSIIDLLQQNVDHEVELQLKGVHTGAFVSLSCKEHMEDVEEEKVDTNIIANTDTIIGWGRGSVLEEHSMYIWNFLYTLFVASFVNKIQVESPPETKGKPNAK